VKGDDSPSDRSPPPSLSSLPQARVTLADARETVVHSPDGDMRALHQMVRELVELNKSKVEENHELMEVISQMRKASVPQPTMGITTPASLHSRLRTSATPFGSRFDGGGVRRPLFVRPPVVMAPPPSMAPVDTSLPSSGTSAPVIVKDPPPPKVNPPKPFKGTLAERDGAENWLGLAMNWLSIAGKGQPEDMRVLMFGTILESDAHTWFGMHRQSAALEGIEVTVQSLSDEFLSKYVGGTTHMMRQQELSSLVYGKGKCVDVVSTQTEFERLASSLFPGASLNPQADQLLAMAFAEVYKRGDFKLWEKAVEMGPTTLDEWKWAIQQAFIIRQTVIEGRKAVVRTTAQTTSISSRPFYSNPSSAPARVHQMDASATEDEEGSSHGMEGEAEVPVEGLQQMGPGKGKDEKKPSKPTGSRRSVLTWPEKQKMMRKGQCFLCYKPNHRAADCPDKDKPGLARRPTAEELNL
jgi:hypothetical protein